MLLSIIVPVYNTECFLPKCVESILQQTFRDFELILVDDGSTDNSLAICDKYATQDERIKVIRKKNGGLISAKKAGLQFAKGDYVGFVDSDDWVAPFMYERLMSSVLEQKADIAIADNIADFGDYQVKVKQGIEYGFYDKGRLKEEVYPNLAYRGKLYELGVSPSLCTKVFRRNLVEEYQFRVSEYIKGGEDAACTYPAIMAAESIVYVENNWGYFYRIHAESMTHKKKLLEIRERVLLLEHIYTEFGKFSYDCVEKQMALYGLGTIEELVFNYFENGMGPDEHRMADLRSAITGLSIWNVIRKQYSLFVVPSSTNSVFEYIEHHSNLAKWKIATLVYMRRAKACIKRVLVKLRLYK